MLVADCVEQFSRCRASTSCVARLNILAAEAEEREPFGSLSDETSRTAAMRWGMSLVPSKALLGVSVWPAKVNTVSNTVLGS